MEKRELIKLAYVKIIQQRLHPWGAKNLVVAQSLKLGASAVPVGVEEREGSQSAAAGSQSALEAWEHGLIAPGKAAG